MSTPGGTQYPFRRVVTEFWGSPIELPVDQNGVWTLPLWDWGGMAYNVAAVGATGDGVSDNSGAFQTMVNIVEAAGAGPILVPPGAYVLNTPLTGISKSFFVAFGATFSGAGAASVAPLFTFSTTALSGPGIVANPVTGDLTLTNGELIFGDAISQIIPGATSLSLRNNAGSADNLLLTDAGLATLRNAIQIPPSAGAALPTITAGAPTVPVKLDDQETASAASVTLTVPAGALYRTLRIYANGRSDQATVQAVGMQLNADGLGNYDYQFFTDTNITITNSAPGIGQTSALVGGVCASGAAAGALADFEIVIFNADSATLRKQFQFRLGWFDTDAAANSNLRVGHGQWRNAANPITSIKLAAVVGNLVNFRAILVGEP